MNEKTLPRQARNRALPLLPFAILALFAGAPPVAADPFTPLSEEEVTVQRLKSFFDGAFIKCSIDSDGDLKVEQEGTTTFLRVEADKKLVTIFSAWNLKESASEAQKLEMVNTMNDKMIYARFCVPRPTTLWCDYQLYYEGGVTPFAIISNYRLFQRVVRAAITQYDPDDIIGSD